ncbi:FG-GAP-like repeat-containing protein [Gracilimonas sp.]|uniref:FG-GAP-like repeat-containing protein n=1 Tax=Gracilimonas sp. TaxID=1974203 RepID=UPI0032EC269C
MKQLILITTFLASLAGALFAQPAITSFSPSRNAIDVSVSSNITISFSEAMNELNAEQPNSVVVKGSLGGIYTTTKSLDAFGTTLTLDPDSDFIPGEIITVRVSQILNEAQTNGLQRSHLYNFTVETNGTGEGYFTSSSTFTGTIGDNSATLTYAGDVDGDGDLDAVILRRSDDTKFYVLRKQDGVESYFSADAYDIADGTNPKGILLNDIDNDGDLDIVVVVSPGSSTRSFYVYTNDGFGTFSSSSSSFHANLNPTDIGGAVFSDFDVDGDDDLFIAGDNIQGLWPFTNDPAGTFNEASGAGIFSGIAGRFAISGDFNNDDYPDFAVIKQVGFDDSPTNDSLGVILSDGSGGFTNQTYTLGISSNPFLRGLAQGDFDGDGYIDLVLKADSLYIMDNNQDGTFTRRALDVVQGLDNLKVGDVNNDGHLDIAMLGPTSVIQFNDGSGNFNSYSTFSRSYGTGFVTDLADADGDGDLDILFSVNGTLTVYKNGVVTAPSSNPTSISLNTNQGTSLGFNMNGGFGTKALVLMKEAGAVDVTPTDDVSYTASSTFGSGSEIGTGNFVVYDGISTSFTVDGLDPGTTYHVEVFQFNAAGPSVKYQTGDITITNATTRTAPTGIVSDLSSSQLSTSITLNWSNSGTSIGTSRIVLAKEGAAVDATPTNSTSYTADAAFQSGTELGSGNYIVYDGSDASVTITGLTAETTYHFAIFEYDGSNGSQRFYTAESATINATTTPIPTIWSKNDSTLTFTKANFADWTQAANQDRITDNVWLTRQDEQGLFNYADETGWNGGDISPSGTQWAFGNTDNLGTLTFDTWQYTILDSLGYDLPSMVGLEMVVYIESDNLYLDLTFDSWTSNGNGGGFSYTRAKGPAPTPITQSFQDSAGYAVQFDGGNTQEEFIEIYIEDYEIISEFSVEMWVKPDVINQDQVFIALGYDDLFIGINSSNQFYATHTEPNAGGGGGEGECCLLKGISATSTSSGASYSSAEIDGLGGSITASVGEWYHVALTGRSGDYLTLYVNGVEQDTVSVEDVSVDESYWVVGSDEDGSKNFFGTIDELRIWKSVRTESEIRSFMHRTYSGPVGRLTGYWQFNEGSGGYTYDGLNNHEGEFYDGIEETWVTSDAPIGEGAVEETTDFQTGTVSVGNAALSMADGFDNPVDVQVTEVTGSPNQFPAGVTAGIGGKYFVINLFGDPGTFSADLTLNFGSGAITAEQETFPELLTLYKRGSSSTGAWTTVGGATSANAATGEVTWTGITSFSQFMATGGEYSFQANDGEPISAAVVSGPSFGSILLDNDVFGFDPVYADSTIEFHISGFGGAEVGIVSDDNENGIAEPGTDPFVTANDAENPVSFTPSTSKLMYISGGGTIDTTTFYFSYYDSEADVTELDTVFAVFGVSDSDEATLENNESENGWYLLSIPQNSSIGSFISPVWTQGAVNSDAPGSDATIYTFNPDNAAYQAVTTDLDTTTLAAGEGLLVYVFEDDDILDGQDDVDGGWPKTLTITGDLFGLNASVPVKNVDADGISGTTGSEGFVLLGNPFGWPISADSVIATLKRTDELANSYVYTWDPVNKTYILSTSGEIDAFESFFVRVVNSGTSGSLSFDYHDVIVSESSPSEKIQNSDMFEFDLVHKNSGIESTSFLRFGEKAKTNIDPYDGYYLGSFASSFANLYTLIGDQPLTINNVPLEADFDKEFPIFMDATVSGNFSLNWKDGRMPEGISATLTLVETGKSFNLNEGGSFEFSIDNSSLSKVAKEMQPVPSSEVVQMAKKEKAEPLFVLSMSSRLGTSNESDLGIPTEVELYQNYPNPFNPTSVIRFGVPEASKVKLEVFDVLGRKVATLLNNETKSSGRYNVQFNARALSSGMYIYRLQVGDKVLVKKMTLIK